LTTVVLRSIILPDAQLEGSNMTTTQSEMAKVAERMARVAAKMAALKAQSAKRSTP